MKLKDGFVLQDVGEEHMAVATGEAGKAFSGLIRNNATADFIYYELLQETTEEHIVDQMCERFDAPRKQIAADVHQVIEKVREAGLLDE